MKHETVAVAKLKFSCFVSIENNTHATMVAQQTMLNLMRGQAQPSVPMPEVSATVMNANAPPAKVETTKSNEASIQETHEAKTFHCWQCHKALSEEETRRFRGKIYCNDHFEKAIG